MARVTGLEPATSGVTGRRSNQLSYTRLRWPPFTWHSNQRQADEAQTTTNNLWMTGDGMVGGDGFEPPTLSV